MPNPHPKYLAKPFSMQSFRSIVGHSGPRTLAAHYNQMVRDYFSKRDDFTGTLDAAMWTATNTGTGSASPVFNAQTNGAVRCVAGTTNPSSSVLYGTNLIFVADDNPMMYVRFKLPAIVSSSCAIEFGFANVVTTKTTQSTSALSAAAVPTIGNGTTDGVLFEWNTGYTLTTPALAGIGTSIAAAGQIVQNSAGTAYSPTAAKWVDLYLAAGVGVGYCEVYENDAFIGRFSVASGPDTLTTLFPFFLVGSLGTAKTIDIDVIELVSERNTR